MSNITKTTFNYDGDPEFLVKDGWYLNTGPEQFYVTKIEQVSPEKITIEFKVLKENNEPAEPVYIWSEPDHCDCEAGDHETERETNQETARLCEPLHKDR